jgi:hypothetical protein
MYMYASLVILRAVAATIATTCNRIRYGYNYLYAMVTHTVIGQIVWHFIIGTRYRGLSDRKANGALYHVIFKFSFFEDKIRFNLQSQSKYITLYILIPGNPIYIFKLYF